jgi:predicted Zn-dependent protease
MDRPEEASAAFADAIEIRPQWWMPYRGLAASRLEAGREDAAIDAYEQGIKATDGHPRLVRALAGLHLGAGRGDQAIAQYESIVERYPDSPVDANNLAMALADHGDGEADLQRAYDLVKPLTDSDNPAFIDTAGWILTKRGETREGIRLLEKAARGAPTAPVIQYHLGMAYLAAGETEQASRHLRAAVESGRNFPGVEEARRELQALADNVGADRS